MAAILDEHNQIDLVTLYKDLQKSLPAYARPMFIRLLKGVVDTTGWIYFLAHLSICTVGSYASLCIRLSLWVQDYSIFVVDNEHANQGLQSRSVPRYTLLVHNIALY